MSNSEADSKRTEWDFHFGLCSDVDGQLIPKADCNELLDLIIDWAESKSYGIGGGFGPCQNELVPEVRSLVPLIYVDDINRSVDFYCQTLGFEKVLTWESCGDLSWCRLQRGNAGVMLQVACEEDPPANERGRGVGFYFFVEDVDAIFAEFTGRGMALDRPTVAFYGLKQLFVTDPDGYHLCFQSPAETEQE